jgi:hypothetical protein
MGLAFSLFRPTQTMSLSMQTQQTENNSAVSSPATNGSASQKAVAVKKRVTKVKAPARPYKKTETEVIVARSAIMKKKISILESKAVILRDRLEQHETELKLRQENA